MALLTTVVWVSQTLLPVSGTVYLLVGCHSSLDMRTCGKSYCTCYAIFGLYSWEGCSFLKVNRVTVYLEERGSGVGNGWREGRTGLV